MAKPDFMNQWPYAENNYEWIMTFGKPCASPCFFPVQFQLNLEEE